MWRMDTRHVEDQDDNGGDVELLVFISRLLGGLRSCDAHCWCVVCHARPRGEEQ